MKVEEAPYYTAASRLLTPAPGKARCLFSSWETIAYLYNFNYQDELENLEINENYFINQAFNKTQSTSRA